MTFLLCLLLLLVGIRAEPASISFVTIVENIRANGRFVQENMMDSTLYVNRTWPWIDPDLHADGNNASNCTRELQWFARDLAKRKLWALKSNAFGDSHSP